MTFSKALYAVFQLLLEVMFSPWHLLLEFMFSLLRWLHLRLVKSMVDWWDDSVLGTWEESIKSVVREGFAQLSRLVNGIATWFISFSDRDYRQTLIHSWKQNNDWQVWWSQDRPSSLNGVLARLRHSKTPANRDQLAEQAGSASGRGPHSERDPDGWRWSWWKRKEKSTKVLPKPKMRTSRSTLFEQPSGWGAAESSKRTGLLEDLLLGFELGVTSAFDSMRWLLRALLLLPQTKHAAKPGHLPRTKSMSMSMAQAGSFNNLASPSAGLRRSQSTGRWERMPSVPSTIEVSSAADLIRLAGYPLEVHTVATSDGYILQLERIPRIRSKDVAFFMHGVLDTSMTWVSAGVTGSQAFAAWDQGFDVWLGNSRCNPPRMHQDASRRGIRYWQYTMNQLGIYDISAQLDHVHAVKCAEMGLDKPELLSVITGAPSSAQQEPPVQRLRLSNSDSCLNGMTQRPSASPAVFVDTSSPSSASSHSSSLQGALSPLPAKLAPQHSAPLWCGTSGPQVLPQQPPPQQGRGAVTRTADSAFLAREPNGSNGGASMPESLTIGPKQGLATAGGTSSGRGCPCKTGRMTSIGDTSAGQEEEEMGLEHQISSSNSGDGPRCLDLFLPVQDNEGVALGHEADIGLRCRRHSPQQGLLAPQQADRLEPTHWEDVDADGECSARRNASGSTWPPLSHTTRAHGTPPESDLLGDLPHPFNPFPECKWGSDAMAQQPSSSQRAVGGEPGPAGCRRWQPWGMWGREGASRIGESKQLVAGQGHSHALDDIPAINLSSVDSGGGEVDGNEAIADGLHVQELHNCESRFANVPVGTVDISATAPGSRLAQRSPDVVEREQASARRVVDAGGDNDTVRGVSPVAVRSASFFSGTNAHPADMASHSFRRSFSALGVSMPDDATAPAAATSGRAAAAAGSGVGVGPYRLRVVAHSLGGASVLMYLVMRYRERRPHHVARLILLSPAGFHHRIPWASWPLYWIIPFVARCMALVWRDVAAAMFIPTFIARSLAFKLMLDAKRIPSFGQLMRLTFRVLLNGDVSQWDRALQMPHYNAQAMPAISLHMALHFIQWVHSGQFCLYDYGSRLRNLRHYGSPTPPNLADEFWRIDVPVDLTAGVRDGIIPPENARLHYRAMKAAGVRVTYREFDFGHMDFTFSSKDELRHYVLARLAA